LCKNINKMTIERKCKWCNKLFMSTNKRVYCSSFCKDAQLLNNNRILKNIVEHIKVCKYCKKTFTTTYSKKCFCSNVCRQTYILNNKIESQKEFRIFNRDNFTCIYCGKSSLVDGVKLEVDHIYPKINGGDNSDFNLITACKNCNNSKLRILLNEENILKLWERNIKTDKTFEELKKLIKI
jgi:5-methylcytosine-specific restriction endonuclease McrA